MISERHAEVGTSAAFDDFYAERWPHAFRLAALMTHDWGLNAALTSPFSPTPQQT